MRKGSVTGGGLTGRSRTGSVSMSVTGGGGGGGGRMSTTRGSTMRASRRSKRPKSRADKEMQKMFQEKKLGIDYSEIPPEIYGTEHIDLHIWSVLADDESLFALGANQLSRVELREQILLAQDKGKTVPGITKYEENLAFKNIKSIDLRDAKYVTDAGLKPMAEAVKEHLVELNLSSCKRVSDAGLRSVAVNCSSITKLSLDNCAKIQGAGLAALADCCHSLSYLSLYHCPQYEEWVLERLSEGAPNLTYLNLEGCYKVTDEGLRALSKRCHDLQTLNLAHCKAVSDVGILSIAHVCTGLETLVLTRTELPFKLTDVGLLALGQKCTALTKLDVGGCEHINDVGLSWLSAGCHALTDLNLANCAKLSDVGILSLSEGCSFLKCLNLANVKKVSDVGIRYLGTGCTRLESLNLSNLFLITDGKVRDFAMEGIQALSGSVPNLKSLVLSGCFQLADLALRSLGAGCRKLERINLSNCPKIAVKGIKSLVSSCTGIRHMILNECDKVDDAALMALGTHCSSLTNIDLSGCWAISDVGTAALIRGSKQLQIMNLTGCTAISDLTLLSLSQRRLMPGIRILNLSGCADVTDTGISWLSEKCPTIIKLNLKGCSVSRTGLRAMQHAWSYVKLREDEQWLGIWPVFRAEDKRFIDAYGKTWMAAMRIQGVARGRHDRKRVHILRLERDRYRAARAFQRLFRGYCARNAVLAIKNRHRRIFLAAARIQSLYRMWAAVMVLKRLKKEALDRLQYRSAVLIQKMYRGLLARYLLQRLKDEREAYYAACWDASIEVQKVWRGFLARREYAKIRAAHYKRLAKEAKAAKVINRICRGYLGRIKARKRKAYLEWRAIIEEKSSITIQRYVRGYAARVLLKRLRFEFSLRHHAATWIQSRWRARGGRLAFFLKRQALKANARDDAVRRIQAMYRGRVGRLYALILKASKERDEINRKLAASKLQRIFRGMKGRKIFTHRLKERVMEKMKVENLYSGAAVNIQRIVRGRFARKRVEVLRQETQKRWKEIWDEENNRYFYYDKNTGEIRLRKPQIILDKMPKPYCDNCGHEIAQVECRDCGEFYCKKCWGDVHFGGKRKGHTFRPVWDGWGRRVDYGDGQWPAVWPSEIEQDEFLGWRVIESEEKEPEGKPAVVITHSDMTPSAGGDEIAVVGYEEDPGAMVPYDGSGTEATGSLELLPPPPDTSLAVHHGWSKYQDDSGYDYYHHVDTGESTYDRPSTYHTPRLDSMPSFHGSLRNVLGTDGSSAGGGGGGGGVGAGPG